MQSSFLMSQTEFANSRRNELLKQAEQRRLIQTITGTQSRQTSLRHRLGSLLVRSGERLQSVRRSRPADDFDTSAGVLHLAR